MHAKPMDKPEIEYPCDWDYRLIGRSEEVLRAAASDIAPANHKIAQGQQSKQGSYISLSLTVYVAHEEQRLQIFDALKAHVDVLFVL
ncbi:MAG: putative lipoic acid-binding regulatory protein [Planctomycetota bacterium]|jgi:putative lipoic acid-binding regulatory protein